MYTFLADARLCRLSAHCASHQEAQPLQDAAEDKVSHHVGDFMIVPSCSSNDVLFVPIARRAPSCAHVLRSSDRYNYSHRRKKPHPNVVPDRSCLAAAIGLTGCFYACPCQLFRTVITGCSRTTGYVAWPVAPWLERGHPGWID